MRSYAKIAIIALSIFLILLILFIFHPMLRTVESQTITYNISIDGLKESEQDMVLDAASIAFTSWESNNPGLVFEESDDGMKIIFTDYFPEITTNAIAICPFWENSENGCYIFISSNVVDIYTNGQNNKNNIANLIAHEIGHVLGFMHKGTKDHLMHGYFGSVFDWTYDREQTFVIPEMHEPKE